MSMRLEYSVPHPKQPEATITGFRSSSPSFFPGASSTDRSAAISSPHQIPHFEYRPILAHALHLAAAVLHHAAETGPHPAGHVLLHGELYRLLEIDPADYFQKRQKHGARAAAVQCIGPSQVVRRQTCDEAVVAGRSVIGGDIVLHVGREQLTRVHAIGR